MTKAQHQLRQYALEHALAQQKLEGLSIPDDVIADLQRVVQGKITTPDVIRTLYAKYAHVDVQILP